MGTETPAEVPSEESVSEATETPQQAPSQEYVSKSDYEAMHQELKQELERLKQSSDDRAKHAASVSSEVTEKLSEFDETYKAMKPLLREDVSEEEVAQLRERQFLQNLMQDSSSSKSVLEPEARPEAETPAPASVPPPFEAEIQTILDTHGVKGDEPELLEYAEKNKGKPWYQIGQGFDELAKSIATRSAGTSVGVVPTQGQAANEDLVKQFREELTEGMKQGQKGMRYLRQLQAKYVEKGADIDDLDISPKGSVQTRPYLYAKDGPR